MKYLESDSHKKIILEPDETIEDWLLKNGYKLELKNKKNRIRRRFLFKLIYIYKYFNFACEFGWGCIKILL